MTVWSECIERLFGSSLSETQNCSCSEYADSAGLLDSLLGGLGEGLGLDDHGDLGESALAQHLKVTLLQLYII